MSDGDTPPPPQANAAPRQADVLIGNVLITFSRMAITVGMGLATTRFAIDALGTEDFGLFAVLGSSIFLIGTLQATLNLSVQRYLAFEIGRNDAERFREVFNTSLLISFAAAALLIVVIFPLIPWIVSLLEMPPDRVRASQLALFCTASTAAIITAFAPFDAAIQAYQKLNVAAVISIIVSALLLAAAISLPWLPGDTLVMYSLLRLGVLGLGVMLGVLWIISRRANARPRPRMVRRKLIRDLTRFGAWTSLGTFAYQLSHNGTQIALNLLFGPKVNASYGIGLQANGYASNLSHTIFQAANPALTQMVGRDQDDSAVRLRDLMSRLAPILTLYVLGPVILETDIVLQLWLGDPPVYTAEFIKIVLVILLVNRLAAGQDSMFAAQDRINRVTCITLAMVVLQLAIGIAVTWWWGLPPWAILIAALAGTIIVTLIKVMLHQPSATHAIVHWTRRVLGPVLLVAAVAFASAWPAYQWMMPGLSRLIAVTVLYTAGLSLASWFIGFNDEERGVFIAFARKLRRAK